MWKVFPPFQDANTECLRFGWTTVRAPLQPGSPEQSSHGACAFRAQVGFSGEPRLGRVAAQGMQAMGISRLSWDRSAKLLPPPGLSDLPGAREPLSRIADLSWVRTVSCCTSPWERKAKRRQRMQLHQGRLPQGTGAPCTRVLGLQLTCP